MNKSYSSRPREGMRSAVLARPSTNNKARSSQRTKRPSTATLLPKQRSTERKPSKIAGSYLKDEECIKLREENWEKENPDFSDVDGEQLQKFIMHLSEYSNACARKEDYQSAKKASDLKLIANNCLKTGGVTKTRALESNKSDDHVKVVQDVFDKRNKAVDDEYEKKLKSINEKQDKDRAEFNKKWTETMPNKFRKPSQKLLQLKAIEKTLANSGDFEKAAEIKKQADQLMKKETQEAQNNLVRDYKVALSFKESTYSQERDVLEQWYKSQKSVIAAEYQKEMIIAEKRKNVIEQKDEEEKKLISRAKPQTPVIVTPSKGEEKLEATLLPPLIPPNDARINELNKKKRSPSKQQTSRPGTPKNELSQPITPHNEMAEDNEDLSIKKTIEEPLKSRQKEEECSDKQTNEESLKEDKNEEEEKEENNLFRSRSVEEPLNQSNSNEKASEEVVSINNVIQKQLKDFKEEEEKNEVKKNDEEEREIKAESEPVEEKETLNNSLQSELSDMKKEEEGKVFVEKEE